MENCSINGLKRNSEALKGLRGSKLGLSLVSQTFFSGETVQVVQDLLGKLLIARSRPEEPFENPRAGVTIGRIVETEAYHGNDPACHAAHGKTPRCAIMFDEPGIAYVYFIYGMYEMLNFVTERRGYPGAVLIRGLEPIEGQELMKRRLGYQPGTNGPGKLCRAMGIRLKDKGESLMGPRLFVADDGFIPEKILSSPRVGISAGHEFNWRFFISENPFVSKVPQNKKARGIPSHG